MWRNRTSAQGNRANVWHRFGRGILKPLKTGCGDKDASGGDAATLSCDPMARIGKEQAVINGEDADGDTAQSEVPRHTALLVASGGASARTWSGRGG